MPQESDNAHELSTDSSAAIPARHATQSSSLAGKVSMLFGVGSQHSARPSSLSLTARLSSEEAPPPLPPRPHDSDQDLLHEIRSVVSDVDDSESGDYLFSIEKAKVTSLTENRPPMMLRIDDAEQLSYSKVFVSDLQEGLTAALHSNNCDRHARSRMAAALPDLLESYALLLTRRARTLFEKDIILFIRQTRT